MDKKMLVLFGSSLLSTLRVESAASGTVYAVFMTEGMTYEQYMTLLGILTAQGLITNTNNRLALTPKGKELAAKIDSVMSAR